MGGQEIKKNHATAALVLGVLQLTVAVITLICSGVMSSKASLSASITPFWSAGPCVVPGILGVVTGCTKSHCCMIANMVVNIIATVLSGISFILVAIAVGLWAAFADGTCTRSGDRCYCRTHDGRTYDFSSTDTCDVVSTISTVLYVLVIFLAIATGLLLAASILGCIAVCCTQRQQQGGMVLQPGQQVVVQQPPPGYAQQQQPPGYYAPGEQYQTK